MPDYARIRGTNFTHAADELSIAPELRLHQWSCIGCEADMFPVAWDPNPIEPYKKNPYFRLAKSSGHVGCDGPDFMAIAGRVYTGRYSQGMPSSLRMLPQRGDAEVVAQRPVGLDGAALGQAAARPARPPQVRTDGTFNMIARSYVQFGENHDQPLRLFDWPGTTYGQNFWKLINYREDGPRLVERQKIFFGPLSHEEAEVGNDGRVKFKLKRGQWHRAADGNPGRWESQYEVTVDLHEQHLGHRTTITNDIKQWIDVQSRMPRDAQEAVGCFFVGLQNPEALNHFTIAEPRLFCFLKTPKPLFDLPPRAPHRR